MGMIYVIEKDGFVKVGYTKNPEKRLRDYRKVHPKWADVAFAFLASGDRALEKKIHAALSEIKHKPCISCRYMNPTTGRSLEWFEALDVRRVIRLVLECGGVAICAK